MSSTDISLIQQNSQKAETDQEAETQKKRAGAESNDRWANRERQRRKQGSEKNMTAVVHIKIWNTDEWR